MKLFGFENHEYWFDRERYSYTVIIILLLNVGKLRCSAKGGYLGRGMFNTRFNNNSHTDERPGISFVTCPKVTDRLVSATTRLLKMFSRPRKLPHRIFSEQNALPRPKCSCIQDWPTVYCLLVNFQKDVPCYPSNQMLCDCHRRSLKYISTRSTTHWKKIYFLFRSTWLFNCVGPVIFGTTNNISNLPHDWFRSFTAIVLTLNFCFIECMLLALSPLNICLCS